MFIPKIIYILIVSHGVFPDYVGGNYKTLEECQAYAEYQKVTREGYDFFCKEYKLND